MNKWVLPFMSIIILSACSSLSNEAGLERNPTLTKEISTDNNEKPDVYKEEGKDTSLEFEEHTTQSYMLSKELYYHSTYKFALFFPESWLNKVEVVESKNTISFFYTPSNQLTARLFSIHIHEQPRTKVENYEYHLNGWNGVLFTHTFPFDLPFEDPNSEEKETYMELAEDIPSILESFGFAETENELPEKMSAVKPYISRTKHIKLYSVAENIIECCSIQIKGALWTSIGSADLFIYDGDEEVYHEKMETAETDVAWSPFETEYKFDQAPQNGKYTLQIIYSSLDGEEILLHHFFIER